LGNSPREFKREIVAGKTIVMTTTNGTRALRACVHAKKVLVASFLNLRATADCLDKEAPAHLILVCSGTNEESAYEDVLCARRSSCLPSQRLFDGYANALPASGFSACARRIRRARLLVGFVRLLVA
jgi:hypothetical protein